MVFKSIGSVVLFLFSFLPLLPGQTSVDTARSNYALLWEITGPDLPGPSYVFGSMHVRYQSVFEFPDSLLICLANSDAFANEIHLDSAMSRVFAVYLDGEELDVDSSYIRFIKERVLEVDTTETEKEERSFSDFKSFLRTRKEGKDLRSGDNMPTMLDAYLMEVARRLGKELYGLENIDEHLYEDEDLSAYTPSTFKFSWFDNDPDELLRLYYEGDLEPIDAFIRAEPEGFNQLALIARNYIMVDAMERIMPEKKLFSVVGTAHLPGKEGVLDLLRKRGYTVRRVMPTFTGLRDSFLIPELERPWPLVQPQRGLYQLGMPVGVQYVYDEDVNTSHLSFDMGKGISYLVLTSSMLPEDYTDFDEYFFAQDGYEVLKKTPYRHRNLDGYRYELELPGNEVENYLAYTFFYDQQLYYLQIGAYEKKSLEENPDVDRFLESFSLLRTNQRKWTSIVDSVGGFRVRMPNNYVATQSGRLEDYPYTKAMEFPQHQYRAGFEDRKASVWLQYYDVSPGSFQSRSWDQLQAGVEQLEMQYALDLTITDRSEYQGFPSWELSGEFVDQGLIFAGRVIARGNRLYLLSLVDDNRKSLTKKFLSSFQLQPLQAESALQEYTYFNDDVQFTLAGKVAEDLSNMEAYLFKNARYQQRIRGLDTISGASYTIELSKYPPEFYVNDSLQFYQEELEDFAWEKDSLLREETLNLSRGPVTKVYVYATEHEQLQRRIQLYHNGLYWVRKSLTAMPDYFEGQAGKAFFAADQWAKPEQSPTLFSGSAQTIVQQLASSDSVALHRAVKAIHPQLTFTAQDLPDLRKVLLNNHWSTFELESYMSRVLVGIVEYLGTPGFEMLSDAFTAIRDVDMQESLLMELARRSDGVARETLFSILAETRQLPEETTAKALSAFRDNPELVIQYWANFSKLMASAQEPLYTWELARQVLAQDSLSKAPLLAARHIFVARGEERLNEWKPQDDKIPAAIFDVYQLLPEAPGLFSQVQQMLDRTQVDQLTVEAAGFLLAKGKEVPKKKVRQILKNPYLRVPFIRILNEYNRLDLVDKRYYIPEDIARRMLLDALTPEGVVANVQLEDAVEVLFRGEPRKAYVFSFDLDEDRSRLAVVGFFGADGEKPKFLDEGLVNYTLYTITRRRQGQKAQQLIEEMDAW